MNFQSNEQIKDTSKGYSTIIVEDDTEEKGCDAAEEAKDVYNNSKWNKWWICTGIVSIGLAMVMIVLIVATMTRHDN